MTKSAIYHHVPSKEALLAAALDEALDGLSATIDAAVTAAPETSAYERLRTAVRQSVEILAAHVPAVTLLLRLRGNSEVELAALKRRRVIDDKLAGLVQAAVDEGSLRADIPPELISRLLFGMVNSLVEWYRPDGPVEVSDLADVDRGPGLRRPGDPGLGTRAGRPGSSLPVRPAASPELGDHAVVGGAAHCHVVHPGAAAQRALARDGDQLVTEPGGLQEADVEARRDRHRRRGSCRRPRRRCRPATATRPPWQRPQPLIMSSRTVIETVAVPGPTATIFMPSIATGRVVGPHGVGAAAGQVVGSVIELMRRSPR